MLVWASFKVPQAGLMPFQDRGYFPHTAAAPKPGVGGLLGYPTSKETMYILEASWHLSLK